jgi:outer membrane protein OmpA-like peptidoglycan-associated protein
MAGLRFLLVISILYVSSHPLFAQNLIPNPGFEEIFTQLEYQWVQPQGLYYHYEKADSTVNYSALTGKYVNGLCMYNYRPNEYLHIKLKEPLKEGVQYRMEVNAVLMRAKSHGWEAHQYIGVHFGDERLNTHIPGDLFLESHVNFKLPDENRFEWFSLVDTFIASGNEAYLTIGYLADTQVYEERQKRQDAFMAELESRYQATQKTEEEKEKLAWLYLPPDEQKKYLKEQRKKDKKNKEEEVPIIAGETLRELEYEEPKMNIKGIFSLRYYFDDFCLTEVRDEPIENPCLSSTPIEEIKQGRDITLQNVFFETDKAVLEDESSIQLEALKKLLDEYSNMEIEIRGYTDDRGAADYNFELSERRAETVLNWLRENGIEAKRLSSKGFGESNPIADNNTEAGRARNRRVTFYIISL